MVLSSNRNALDVTASKDLSKAGTTEKSQPVKSVSPVPYNTVSIVPVTTGSRSAQIKESVPDKPPQLVCPGKEVPRPFFSIPCAATKECAFLGRGILCCDGRCLRGVQPPKPEPKHSPIRNLVSYMQCTPPPPPLLDLFPKPCETPLDCFPNLCCQEGGKRFCRPPKRSLFALLAGIGQRLIPARAARRLIERITT
ncbi:hypothetical protein NQ314_012286 [Rhamnusium bicolor]|uniref:Uncharacterized protein n=1 Tax=Rhamnusium bicolor TaxID=1586634 RepID=A0AAV8XCA5_9CUCU|nr:hypothetical protein NQ314_012286 [Rhamnusium bicolor]